MGTDFSISKLVAVLAVAITSLGGVLWAGDGYTMVELAALRTTHRSVSGGGNLHPLIGVMQQ